ncbi:MAG: helix-turn-helix transcriptional regulator [Candidatus Aquilonibacter sp.]
MMLMTGERVDPQSSVSDLLRRLRGRVPPEATTLGSYKRLPIRCGRRVTQEELAEVVGVTRGWYRLLESGGTVRASMKLLDRLANALTLTSDERIALFMLAIPEMEPARGS